jgi:hypothetical protein
MMSPLPRAVNRLISGGRAFDSDAQRQYAASAAGRARSAQTQETRRQP